MRTLLPFRFVDELSENAITKMQANIKENCLNKGQIVIEKGHEASGVYIVKSGVLRLYTLDKKGNEKLIDYMGEGGICVFSINCVANKVPYPAWVKVDSDKAQLIKIPASVFRPIYFNEPSISEFVLLALAKRVDSMMTMIEDMVTLDIGQKINQLILHLAIDGSTISISHQDIADRLGTAREVVSRHLKELEKQGVVSLSRLKITLIAPEKLSLCSA